MVYLQLEFEVAPWGITGGELDGFLRVERGHFLENWVFWWWIEELVVWMREKDRVS